MKTHVEWYSTKEAAIYLGFPTAEAFRDFLARQRAQGRVVRVHWLGNTMRFRRTDLDALLEPEPQPSARPVLSVVGGKR